MDGPAPARRALRRRPGRPDLVLPPPRRVRAAPLQGRVRPGRAYDGGGDHDGRPPPRARRLVPPGISPYALARRPLLRHLPLALAGLYGYPPGARRALRRTSPARPTYRHNDRASRPLLPLCGDAHTPWCPRTRLEVAPRRQGAGPLATPPGMGRRRPAYPGLAGAARSGRSPRQAAREARIPRQDEGGPYCPTSRTELRNCGQPPEGRTIFPEDGEQWSRNPRHEEGGRPRYGHKRNGGPEGAGCDLWRRDLREERRERFQRLEEGPIRR